MNPAISLLTTSCTSIIYNVHMHNRFICVSIIELDLQVIYKPSKKLVLFTVRQLSCGKINELL